MVIALHWAEGQPESTGNHRKDPFGPCRVRFSGPSLRSSSPSLLASAPLPAGSPSSSRCPTVPHGASLRSEIAVGFVGLANHNGDAPTTGFCRGQMCHATEQRESPRTLHLRLPCRFSHQNQCFRTAKSATADQCPRATIPNGL